MPLRPLRSDVVKVVKFVETSVLPVLQKAQAESSTIEAVTAMVSPQAANIERVGFAVLGVVIKAVDDAGTGAARSRYHFERKLSNVHRMLQNSLFHKDCLQKCRVRK